MTLALAVLAGEIAFAHCDSLDGPVVNAARAALASGDVNQALVWVKPDGEPVIRQAFERTLTVRKMDPRAKELADTWFFETLVRVHRQGEGAAYDGLKPAGRDLGPAIPAADLAIRQGNAEKLVHQLSAAVVEQLQARFRRVMAVKGYQAADLKAGREYVEAYVDFLHFAERVHQAVSAGGAHAAEHEH